MRFPAFAGDRTAYEVLGVDPACDQTELKAAFRRCSREHHPDMVASRGGSQAEIDRAGEYTAQLTVAYRLLGDEDTRAEYDAFLAVEPEPELDVDEGWEDVDIVDEQPETPVDPGPQPRPVAFVEPLPVPPKIPRKTGLEWWFATGVACGVVGLVADLVLHQNLLRWAGLLVGGWLVFSAAKLLWHRSRHRVGLRGLEAAHLYGQASGTSAEAQLEEALARIVWRVPWAVMVRAGQPDAPFSHAVVAGNRIALFAAVPVDAGTWQWQGNTLVSPRVFNWVQGPTIFWERSAQLGSRLRRAHVRQTVVLIPTTPGDIVVDNGNGPVLTVIDRLGAVTNWLGSTRPELRHDVVCDALDLLQSGQF